MSEEAQENKGSELQAFAKAMSVLAWLATIGGAGLASLYLYSAVSSAEAAPAQAAGAAIACALVVVPYCAARAIDGLRR